MRPGFPNMLKGGCSGKRGGGKRKRPTDPREEIHGAEYPSSGQLA